MVKDRVSHTCRTHHDGLYKAFGIDVMEDETEVHPSRFCNRCYASMTRKSFANSLVPFEWTAHTNECRVRSKLIMVYCDQLYF